MLGVIFFSEGRCRPVTLSKFPLLHQLGHSMSALYPISCLLSEQGLKIQNPHFFSIETTPKGPFLYCYQSVYMAELSCSFESHQTSLGVNKTLRELMPARGSGGGGGSRLGVGLGAPCTQCSYDKFCVFLFPYSYLSGQSAYITISSSVSNEITIPIRRYSLILATFFYPDRCFVSINKLENFMRTDREQTENREVKT